MQLTFVKNRRQQTSPIFIWLGCGCALIFVLILAGPINAQLPDSATAEPELIETRTPFTSQAKPSDSPVRSRRIMVSPLSGAVGSGASPPNTAIKIASNDPAEQQSAFAMPEISVAAKEGGQMQSEPAGAESESASEKTFASTIPSYIVAQDDRPRILFQPAVPARDSSGLSILKPAVHLDDSFQTEIEPAAEQFGGIAELSDQWGDGRVPAPVSSTPDPIWVPNGFGDRFAAFRENRRRPLANLYGRFSSAMKSQRGRDAGVGIERLPFALFEVDGAQPSNNFRLRFEAATDWEFPDRVEYFWSHIGKKGPDATIPVESSVDYQDIRLAFEVGGEKFSAMTEIPLHFINPTVVGNTGGMGDMVLTTKTVMLDGDDLQITQVLRNQLPTGSSKRGRGNGHASMEPGFVARYGWSERTQIHNELKLWFPLGGEPGFSGPVLRYGFGYANVLYDSDTFAVIPTFEVVAWSILSGQKTTLIGQTVSIDGENIVNLYPGVRLVRDSNGGMGLFEIGISGGTSVTERHWYQSMIRLDLRWTF
ncbi:MAG: hypothetical protein KDB00_00815 [Planctomycetales bacterium]|nr:hypothetical protein [Planctomycetales bacterium]